MIAHSLRWRLLLIATAAILAALAAAWLFMTVLFEGHLERRMQAELTGDALVLVAGVGLDASGRPVFDGGGASAMDAPLSDPRWSRPASGHYWQVTTRQGTLRSRSLWDETLPPGKSYASDAWQLRRASGPFGQSLFILERQVMLESDQPPVVVQLAQDLSPLSSARAEFGRELAFFLVLLWLFLSGAAWLQVTLGLRPLGRIRGDLAQLSASARVRLPPSTLREIQPLTEAINALADVRERDLQVARRRAADLAHGLKTPLAAATAQSRRAREAGALQAADGMDRAIAAIRAAVEAELARSRIAATGHRPGAETAVRSVVERLVNVLEHTERGGQIAFAIEVPTPMKLAIDAEALAEILGAVLDNATRYARRFVRITAHQGANADSLIIEDDGPGIASERFRDVLTRGTRLDESREGTGLGLAIARELAEATGGAIALDASQLGGLRVCFNWDTVVEKTSVDEPQLPSRHV